MGTRSTIECSAIGVHLPSRWTPSSALNRWSARRPWDDAYAVSRLICCLSAASLAVLPPGTALTSTSESGSTFPTESGRPLHGGALSAALQSLRFDSKEVTPHGFRATACTLLNELGWRSEAIERQMAHGVSDSVRRHYNYAQHLPERRVMMQAWADYLDGLRSAQNEMTSTPLLSRFASAHALKENRA